MKESELEKNCIFYLSSLNPTDDTIAYWKIKAAGQKHSFGGKTFFKKSTIAGFSDLLLCINGCFVSIELKVKGGRQAPVQKDFQKTLQTAKGRYYIVYTFDEFVNLIQKLLKELV